MRIKTTIFFMGFISAILNISNCLGQVNTQDGKQEKEINEQLIKSLEAFKKRPIFKELTAVNIDTTSDENLLQIVFDNLNAKQQPDYENEYETVMSWNKSRQAIYMIWILEAEVNNGGYNQFYFNSRGQFYKHLLDALKLVGADKLADVTERANKTFESEHSKITQHQDGTIEGFLESYEDNPLNAFDTEFYKLSETENLQKLQVDYIRSNKKEFIDK